MIETNGFFRPGVKMILWIDADRKGDVLRAIYSQETEEWSVATYGAGTESSAMNRPGEPTIDNSEIFQGARALERMRIELDRRRTNGQ